MADMTMKEAHISFLVNKGGFSIAEAKKKIKDIEDASRKKSLLRKEKCKRGFVGGISVKDKLPNDGEYVLVYLNNDNWGDDDDPLENRYFKVCKFCTCEVYGNNTVPYEWETFGASKYFGQEVDYWGHLPPIK